MGKLGNFFFVKCLDLAVKEKSKQVKSCSEQIKSIMRADPSCNKLDINLEKNLSDIFYRYTAWNNNKYPY